MINLEGFLDDFNFDKDYERLKGKKLTDKRHRAIVIAVTDVMLVTFLKEKYPEVWEEFKEDVHRDKEFDD